MEFFGIVAAKNDFAIFEGFFCGKLLVGKLNPSAILVFDAWESKRTLAECVL